MIVMSMLSGWCSAHPRLSLEKYGIPCQVRLAGQGGSQFVDANLAYHVTNILDLFKISMIKIVKLITSGLGPGRRGPSSKPPRSRQDSRSLWQVQEIWVFQVCFVCLFVCVVFHSQSAVIIFIPNFFPSLGSMYWITDCLTYWLTDWLFSAVPESLANIHSLTDSLTLWLTL